MTRLLVLLIFFQLTPMAAVAQRQQKDEVGARFFDQLRSLFGRFRDGDLDRAFDAAQPIQCAELVSDNGEWRPVAFFNEDRKLGDWYHATLDEVKSDLSQFLFTGSCSTDQSSVQLVSKVPYRDSLDRYMDGRIRFNDIRILTNPSVRAIFDSKSKVYNFELPLFLDRAKSTRSPVYTSMPERLDDRPIPDLVNRWDCKSVRELDVTFHFLICQTWATSRGAEERKQNTRVSRGAFAYFIMSDGREATTSTKLSFNISEDGTAKAPPAKEDKPVEEVVRNAPLPEQSVSLWQNPNSGSKLGDLQDKEFRMLFSPQTWGGKVNTPQVLMDQKISIFDPAKTPAGVDYCTWRPASSTLVSRVLSKDPDSDVDYTLSLSSSSFTFEMKTHTGTKLGALQCFFPKTSDLSSVTLDQWVNVVGAHLTLEIRH
jgi:hypothetical protein